MSIFNRKLFQFLSFLVVVVLLNSTAKAEGRCDIERLNSLKAEFENLVDDQSGTKNRKVKQIAQQYLSYNEICFAELYSSKGASETNSVGLQVDDGGVWFDSSSQAIQSENFVTSGSKWGQNSPFAGGTNAHGPGTTGGVVTYSFMASGVSHAVEGAGVNANSALQFFPTFQNCFLQEFTRAFALWSAVADIDFRLVGDNGVASNSPGASGDIRIGGHDFDGPSGTLAHAFFPPPNGTTIAGDMHFDTAENWTCGTTGIDIGIVTIHELGHAIGLRHEQSATAIMNPFYNPALNSPLSDDINGAVAIYGPAIVVPPTPEPTSAPVVTPVISIILDDDE